MACEGKKTEIHSYVVCRMGSEFYVSRGSRRVLFRRFFSRQNRPAPDIPAQCSASASGSSNKVKFLNYFSLTKYSDICQ